MIITAKGKVWKYPGFGGWHFFTIGKTLSSRIKKMNQAPRRGFGSIHVKAKIGNTEWKTSIFPTKEGTYLLAIKAEVRKRENITIGDTITVTFTFFIQ
jgi:hypothetical protein